VVFFKELSYFITLRMSGEQADYYNGFFKNAAAAPYEPVPDSGKHDFFGTNKQNIKALP